jgi:putative transposase
VYGLFARLHLDNAKEFRSEALRRGCEQYGIAIDYRPVRTPHYGGHIERLIGTMMGKVHLLPGTTFSDVRVKGDWNPEKTAAMTVEELERWLVHAIVGVYHRTLHRALDTTPLAAWERGIIGDEHTPGCGEPVGVPDPRRFLIDFLPLERRLIRRDGVSLHSIHYWSDVLRSWIGESQQVIVRYDPRDLSRIYLLAPNGQYYDLSYRDLRRPSITLWEHRLALKRLREEGALHIDETAIFRTIEKMHEIVNEAALATKSARRQRERRLRLIHGGRSDAPSPDQLPTDTSSIDDDNKESTQQPWENMLPFEEWT